MVKQNISQSQVNFTFLLNITIEVNISRTKALYAYDKRAAKENAID